MKKLCGFIPSIGVLCVLLAMALTSCRPSHIYNASMDLAPKPLEKGEIYISGRYGYAPEARTSAIGRQLSPMGAASVKYGLTNRISLGAEGWTDFSDGNIFNRGGYAFSVPILVQEGERLDWQLIPRYGFVLEKAYQAESVSAPGHGFSLSAAAYVKTGDSQFKPYFGLTGLYGFSEFSANRIFHSELQEYRYPSGFAAIAHGGLNYECLDWLNLNVELPIIYQYNNYDKEHDVIPAPSVGFSVGF